MLNRIFPSAFDNHYRGSKIALWLFVLITFVNTSISLVAIFRPDGGAQSADGIPLDKFGPDAAQAVIGVVAFLGLASLSLCVLFIVALICYRRVPHVSYLHVGFLTSSLSLPLRQNNPLATELHL